MRFPAGNTIRYVQGKEARSFVGVPPDVDFEIVLITQEGMVCLRGVGYGGTPYGQGVIYVYLETASLMK